MGYRHIDCAMIYQNEHEVGEVFGEMLDKEVPRSEFFIVGKVYIIVTFYCHSGVSSYKDHGAFPLNDCFIIALGNRSST